MNPEECVATIENYPSEMNRCWDSFTKNKISLDERIPLSKTYFKGSECVVIRGNEKLACPNNFEFTGNTRQWTLGNSRTTRACMVGDVIYCPSVQVHPLYSYPMEPVLCDIVRE